MKWTDSFSTLTKNATVVVLTGAGSMEWKHHLCWEDIPVCVLFFSTALVYSESEFYIDIKCEFIAAEVRNVGKRHTEKSKIDCPCKMQKHSMHQWICWEAQKGWRPICIHRRFNVALCILWDCIRSSLAN